MPIPVHSNHSSVPRVSLDIEPANPLMEANYIAFIHKKTNSGHVVMIYETSKSPVIAMKRLKRLIEKN